MKVAGVENSAGLPSQAFWLKCAQVREIALSKVLLFRRHRLPAKDLIAVRVTTKCCNDLADVFGLFHQGSIDRLQVFRGGGSNFSAQADEEVDALEVVGAFAVTEWLGEGDLEPRRIESFIVASCQARQRQFQCGSILRECPRRAPPE
ncbi:hypothetical protein EBBID32_10880 [Sphingobium indicum BiD32]|uniref:Uncharacterized protein n=1 Tax=Sphingobium indicum BiD32 TaxID=1301087 RepID=N1MHR6_9SPHN|nr:hypothetical protein EBBID32_10880 [Sphingobium indicum BiD32]